MAKKAVKKVAPKSVKAPEPTELELKFNKLVEYLKAQVDVKTAGGDNFLNYPDL